MEKILLFNDTSLVDSNPGCIITVSELKENLRRNYGNNVDIVSYPLGFGYKYFKYLNSKKNESRKRYILKIARRFAPILLWQRSALQLYKNELNKLAGDELIIINAEGTIHHNTEGAHTLLGIGYILSKKGFKVHIVNGTFFKLNPKLLKNALKKVEKVVVREGYSFDYLKSFLKDAKPKIEQGADCVFLAKDRNVATDQAKSSTLKRCLFSPGVLLSHPQKNTEFDMAEVKTIINHLKALGYQISFFQIEKKESGFANEFGIFDVIHAHESKGYKIFDLLSEFDLVVTGRYHVLIFAAMLGKAFIPLPTNTWKINGVLRLLGIESAPTLTGKEGIEDIEKLTKIDPKNLRGCYELASKQH